MKNNSRHPYTASCDLIILVVGHHEREIHPGTAKLSRADASKIRSLFSHVLGLNDEMVACKLANYLELQEETLSEKAAQDVIRILERR